METKINLAAVISGVVLAFAFPPFLSGFIAYFGLVPILFLTRGIPAKHALRIGFLWGLGFNSFALYWIGYDTVAGSIAAILYLSFLSMFFPLVFSYGYKVWGKMFLWAVPFLWLMGEYLRYFGQLRFPWLTLGHTQSYYTSLIQYCAYAGVYAVSFWICLLNVVIYFFILEGKVRSRQKLWGAIAASLILIPYVYGKFVINKYKASDASVKIALIQGNIDPWAKWDKAFKDYNFQTYENLSIKAAQQKSDLMIWPESAATSYLLWDEAYLSWVHRIVDSVNTPLLTGAIDAEFEHGSMARKDFNSALFFQPHSEKVQSYAKILLVPVSEHFPFSEYLPFLARIDLGQGPSNFTPGSGLTIFEFQRSTDLNNNVLPDSAGAIAASKENSQALKAADNRNSLSGAKNHIKFATVICFESIFPALVRQFCVNPIDFLVVITNDGWFGKSSSPFQHAQFAVFRAIENRISIARCANTGISSFINPLGQVLDQSPIFEPAVLVRNIPLRHERTFYTSHGDWFPRLVSIIGGILLLITIIKGSFPLLSRNAKQQAKLDDKL